MSRLKSIISLLLPLTIIFTPIAYSSSNIETDSTQTTEKIKKATVNSALDKQSKSIKKKSKQLKYASVNINKASVKELMLGLKGIGKKKAKAIVDYRTKNGDFKVNDDLLKVKGIGKKLLKKNEGRIQLSGQSVL